MTPRQIAALTRRIVDELFSSGDLELAARLELKNGSGESLGWWNRRGVTGIVREEIERSVKAARPKTIGDMWRKAARKAGRK